MKIVLDRKELKRAGIITSVGKDQFIFEFDNALEKRWNHGMIFSWKELLTNRLKMCLSKE